MFPLTDPHFQLDLYHQRADEWHREAAAYRLAREASGGRHRHAWWHRPARRPRPVRVPATS